MYQKVDAWVDLVALDHKILAFWEKNRSLGKLREIIRGKPPWSFLDGPITANNPMGLHHAWGRSLKDAFQRYWAMNRRDLRYQNGFDCQGLWVEVEVEKELGFSTKKDIETYGIGKFVEQCKSRVVKYADIMTRQSIRLGYWMDWDNSYFTMGDENNYSIWGFLKECHKRGLVYKGHDVMPWCPRCGTGISQQEMSEGYKDVVHDSVIVKFPIRDRTKEALLVWTTTPWTLSSNVAAAVHPDLDYVKAGQGEWIYYLAASPADQILGEHGPYEVLNQLKGNDLLHLSYDGPFDELLVNQAANLPHPVISWDEVSDEEGTGIVHIAPGCGKEDYQLGIEYGLDIISPIDEAGVFLRGFEPLTGKHASGISPDIFDSLRDKDILYQVAPYTHSYPHCWRCKEPLLYRRVDEWFISMDEWREDIMAITQQAQWIPSFGLDQEMDWLKNMQDWMISKKRYWGLALPIWECQACGGFQVIGSREELEAKAKVGWNAFEGHTPHRPWIDDVKIACDRCNGTASRIPDVGNPWLDAGIVAYSTMSYRTDREYWEKWTPADLVLECFPGQFRNWFYSLLAMSTMMENKAPFKALVGHALVNDEQGEEMHKSGPNSIPFDQAAEKMGCDVLRWVFGRQDLGRNLNFGYNIGKETRGRFINTLWNTYGFFINYARLAEWTPSGKPTAVAQRADFDRWILSGLQGLVHQSHRSFQTYDIKGLVLAAERFTENLSNGYIRHNRRRFWKVGNEADSAMAFETLYDCLYTLIRVLAPIIPFITEEMYQNLVRGHDDAAPESVHHTEFPEFDAAVIDEGLTNEITTVMAIIGLGHSARERARIKNRQPLSRLILSGSNERENQAALKFAPLLKEFLNVKTLDVLKPNTPKPEIPVLHVAKPKLKVIAKKIGKKRAKALKKYAKNHGKILAEKVQAAKSFHLDLDGESVVLDPVDFLLKEKSPDDLAFAEEKGIWVSFDTGLDDDLKLEGLMRDLLRHLQVLRKEIGLEIEDRIGLTWQADDPRVKNIFTRWESFLNGELLCVEQKEGKVGDNGNDIELSGIKVKVEIAKGQPGKAGAKLN